MNLSNNNTCQHSSIEKFEGTFDKEEFGVVIVPIKTINEIRNPEALGIYVYLLGRPKNWKLSVKQLMAHFECGRDKIRKILNFLLKESFITCIINKQKGRFIKPHYRVHLSRFSRFSEKDNSVDFKIDQPETHASTESSPEPENPAPENTDTYITYNINNIEKDIKNTYVDFKKSPKEYKCDSLFMKFYECYPNKQKPRVAYKAFLKHQPTPEFVSMVCSDVNKRMENNWKGRDKNKIPHPATYLNHHEWESEIYAPSNEKSTKYKSWDEIINSDLMAAVL